MKYYTLSQHISNLSFSSSKGDNGIILIIGGSELYTGAPYFAAISALRTGADLVYIFSYDPMPLKSMLPECIICYVKYIPWILDRCDVCLVGCGLDIPKDPEILNRIIAHLIERNIPLVIDGDGIKHYIKYYDLFMLYDRIIITPNKNERKRIKEKGENHFFLCKGATDILVYKDIRYDIKKEGCPKRCGGQGDILAGVLATYLCWVPPTPDCILSCMEYAALTTKNAAYKSFSTHGRALISSYIIKEIPNVVKNILFDGIVKDKQTL
ncbi:ATP-dependent (S)-NAD(P)H-hydrate dehydratase [Astathelohania contejeani]|uniref:ATP-dependent (S)-NAD(P)H-hydrate dehydratase n=1 Tax=Astathelohania contejeani TaxID=164912 RepID=A0ABQ7I2Y7_9MICR|nr:ATP-dependent (S)-NAD(P)H-hydrate dehydratase [Thelohania contejeani]